MRQLALETVNITLGFSSRPFIHPLLERMTHASKLAVNIVRGRVTPDNATYEIQMKESQRGIARALRHCRGDGIQLRMNDSTIRAKL